QQVGSDARRSRPRLRLGGAAAFLVSHHRMLLRPPRSDRAARCAGSVLGLGWIVLAPASILGLYAVVYVAVFRVRIPTLSTSESRLFLLCGLVSLRAPAEQP